jgi:hypothetical protein
MLLDGARRRIGARARAPRRTGVPARSTARRQAIAWAALLIVVLGIGATDETSNFYLVSYAAAAREYHSDQAFGRAMEATLPRGSNVFELPYVPFPEGYHVAGVPATLAFATSYELFRPYLNTTGLNFSFGAMKGRPADWESALSAKPLNLAIAGAAASGFSGVYVDPRGYGAQAPRVDAWLRQLLGVAPLVARLDDAWFFDLRPYAHKLDAVASPAALAALRQATLHPLETACGPGPAELELTNPSSSPVQASLSATLENGVAGHLPVVITFPGGATERRTISPSIATLLQRRLVVPPGTSSVTFSTVAAPTVRAGPAANLVISDATLTAAAFAPFRRFETISGRTPPQAGLVAPSCAVQYEATSPPL